MNESHWETQHRRREQFLREATADRRYIVRAGQQRSATVSPGHEVTPLFGVEAGIPTRLVDATVHRLEPRASSLSTRASWDQIVYPLRGNGWTEVDGQRYQWRPWDAIYVPAFSLHNMGAFDESVEYVAFTSMPLLETLNLAWVGGEESSPPTGPAPPFSTGSPAATQAQRVREARKSAQRSPVHVDYDHAPLRPNPKGTRSKFLVDESLGHQTSGLSLVMLEFAAGYHQSMHRHPGEAYLYVLNGRGHSFVGKERDDGEVFEWSTGDLIVVDHFVWHQHFNDDPDGPAQLVRVHMHASMLNTMRALLDPLDLFQEDLSTAPDMSGHHWPPEQRPGA